MCFVLMVMVHLESKEHKMALTNNRIATIRLKNHEYNLDLISKLPNILVISIEYEYDSTARIFFQCDTLHEVAPGNKVPSVSAVFEADDNDNLIFKMFVYDRDAAYDSDKTIIAPARSVKNKHETYRRKVL